MTPLAHQDAHIDALVLLVKKNRAHLAFATRDACLKVSGLALCAEPLDGSEHIGCVADDDLHDLHAMNICIACSTRYLNDLRNQMTSRVAGASEQQHASGEQLELL